MVSSNCDTPKHKMRFRRRGTNHITPADRLARRKLELLVTSPVFADF